MFTINNKEYEDAKLTFGDLVRLEEQGIDFNNIADSTFKTVVIFLSVAMKCSMSEAIEEINAHIENGNDFNDLIEIINTMVDESAFFKNLRKMEKAEQKKGKNTKAQKNG